MTLSANDFAILDKMKLERKPVGVKFMASQRKTSPILKKPSICAR